MWVAGGGWGHGGDGNAGRLNDLWFLYDVCDDPDTVPSWDDNITSNNDGSGYFIVDIPAGFLFVELVTEDSDNITLFEPHDVDCAKEFASIRSLGDVGSCFPE